MWALGSRLIGTRMWFRFNTSIQNALSRRSAVRPEKLVPFCYRIIALSLGGRHGKYRLSLFSIKTYLTEFVAVRNRDEITPSMLSRLSWSAEMSSGFWVNFVINSTFFNRKSRFLISKSGFLNRKSGFFHWKLTCGLDMIRLSWPSIRSCRPSSKRRHVLNDDVIPAAIRSCAPSTSRMKSPMNS